MIRPSVSDSAWLNVRAALPLQADFAEYRYRRSLTLFGVTLVNGGCFFGSGRSGYVTINSPGINDVNWAGREYYIDAEIYVATTPSGTGTSSACIIGNSSSGTNYWSFGVTSGLALNFYYWTGGQNNLTSSRTVPFRRWCRVGMANTAGRLRLYIEGEQVASVATPAGQYSTSIPFRIGYAGYGLAVDYLRNLRVTADFNRRGGGEILSYRAPEYLPIHGAVAAPTPARAPYFQSLISFISGTCAALDTADVSAVTAVLRTTGALTSVDSVDLSAIQAGLFGLIATEGGDAAALVGQLGTAAAMAATEIADLVSALGKVATRGSLAAVELSGDEWTALGRVWPTMYKAITGVSLNSPATVLALSSVLTAIGSFPPSVVSDVTMPDDASAGSFPPVLVSDLTMP